MSINAVSSTGPAMGQAITGGSLTPDALMLYCASRLNSLDEGISSMMNKQEQSQTVQKALGKVKDLMSGGGMDKNDYVKKGAIMDAMKEAYDALPPGDPMRERLQETFKSFVTDACFNDGKLPLANKMLSNYTPAMRDELVALPSIDNNLNEVSAKSMEGYASNLGTLMGELSKGAELQMINLQSLVSQRQMAVQITTQLLAKMNETSMAIANSIGK